MPETWEWGSPHSWEFIESVFLETDIWVQVKLVDFGFTREYERQKLLQTFCGTVCYSAPEMLIGERYMAHGE